MLGRGGCGLLNCLLSPWHRSGNEHSSWNSPRMAGPAKMGACFLLDTSRPDCCLSCGLRLSIPLVSSPSQSLLQDILIWLQQQPTPPLYSTYFCVPPLPSPRLALFSNSNSSGDDSNCQRHLLHYGSHSTELYLFTWSLAYPNRKTKGMSDVPSICEQYAVEPSLWALKTQSPLY